MSHLDRHNPSEAFEIDVIAVLSTLRTHVWRIVLIAAVVTALGTAWAFLWPPKYQADILVQIEDVSDGAAAGTLLGDVSSLFDVKSSAAAEAQILASRLVLSRTVDKQRLFIDVTPARFPLIGDFVSRVTEMPHTPGVFGFGGFAWGQESAELTRLDVPKQLQEEPFSLIVEPGGRYELRGDDLSAPVHGKIGAERTVSTQYGPVVINVARMNASPGTRFTVVRHGFDETVDLLQKRLEVQEKVKQSGVLVATLLGRDPERTGRTLRDIGDQYLKQNVERKYADAAQSLAFLDVQLPVLRRKLEDAQDRLTALRIKRGVVDLPVQTTTGLQRQVEVKAQLVQLQQRRAELMTRYTAMHPEVVATDKQMSVLQAEMEQFDVALRRLPDLEQETARLMLDVKVNTDLYTATLNNVQQLQLVKAGKVGSVRVVDTPAVLDVPTWPNRCIVIIAAALGGLLLGIAYAFAREFLRGGVNSAEEIERRVGMPVLTAVPFSAKQKLVQKQAMRSEARQVSLLASEAPDDPAIEALRSLRTALRMRLAGTPSKVIIVSGAAPGAGKSFVTANLALVLASMGQRVLLIDSDLRRSSLRPYFGIGQGTGWADAIAGRADFASTVHRAESTGLDFVAAGSLVSNPAELLASSAVGALIDAARNKYDYVLIDTPPILAVDDAAAVASHADSVLLVAQAGVTRIGEVRESAKRLNHAALKQIGVVLNGVPARSIRSTYGSHGYSTYNYATPADANASRLGSWLRSWLGRR
ncbi:polysaccharide biosynthesis tyrosine autokinase [Caballeronia sp. ATUFL_M2_KS44]|uniref:polysaccharide biosynthesis tyrosine autokinase n=1 Tax=Caballeronia sp. ATUFL_M2_KS44 TaxID=2921767 RepID=UPI00202939E4|nr:polysaccharide biosynthesis tyrosine autokinase [Caballeronia sp. ATUFL_M2_KS44]